MTNRTLALITTITTTLAIIGAIGESSTEAQSETPHYYRKLTNCTSPDGYISNPYIGSDGEAAIFSTDCGPTNENKLYYQNLLTGETEVVEHGLVIARPFVQGPLVLLRQIGGGLKIYDSRSNTSSEVVFPPELNIDSKSAKPGSISEDLEWINYYADVIENNTRVRRSFLYNRLTGITTIVSTNVATINQQEGVGNIGTDTLSNEYVVFEEGSKIYKMDLITHEVTEVGPNDPQLERMRMYDPIIDENGNTVYTLEERVPGDVNYQTRFNDGTDDVLVHNSESLIVNKTVDEGSVFLDPKNVDIEGVNYDQLAQVVSKNGNVVTITKLPIHDFLKASEFSGSIVNINGVPVTRGLFTSEFNPVTGEQENARNLYFVTTRKADIAEGQQVPTPTPIPPTPTITPTPDFTGPLKNLIWLPIMWKQGFSQN